MPVLPRPGVRGTFDAIAEEFDASRRDPWPAVVRFAEGLERGSRVLDLGCGNGRHLRVLATTGARGAGLDASRALLGKARDAGPVVQGDLVHLPFRDHAADACLLIACVHHLGTEAERIACLREARRVVRPGGRLLATAWALEQSRFAHLSPTGPALGTDALVPWKRSVGPPVERFYHLFAEGELERLLGSAGWAVRRFMREEDNYIAEGRHDG